MLDQYRPFVSNVKLEMLLGILLFVAGTLLFNDSLRGGDGPIWSRPFNWM